MPAPARVPHLRGEHVLAGVLVVRDAEPPDPARTTHVGAAADAGGARRDPVLELPVHQVLGRVHGDRDEADVPVVLPRRIGPVELGAGVVHAVPVVGVAELEDPTALRVDGVAAGVLPEAVVRDGLERALVSGLQIFGGGHQGRLRRGDLRPVADVSSATPSAAVNALAKGFQDPAVYFVGVRVSYSDTRYFETAIRHRSGSGTLVLELLVALRLVRSAGVSADAALAQTGPLTTRTTRLPRPTSSTSRRHAFFSLKMSPSIISRRRRGPARFR